jgi:hypothetical protein
VVRDPALISRIPAKEKPRDVIGHLVDRLWTSILCADAMGHRIVEEREALYVHARRTTKRALVGDVASKQLGDDSREVRHPRLDDLLDDHVERRSGTEISRSMNWWIHVSCRGRPRGQEDLDVRAKLPVGRLVRARLARRLRRRLHRPDRRLEHFLIRARALPLK